jgi:ABC-2 type transport system ATP-binding protein
MRINGHDVSSQKDRVRKDIGIVFQESTLDAKLTVEENLQLHCNFYKVPGNEAQNRIRFALELVEMTNWRKALVGSLSGGMKRRVEIARGLVHFPKVLFLDEPTTGLDPQTRASVWVYIQRLQKEKNITIFLSTHYMDEAEICSNVAIIDHGKLIALDTPENLKRQFTNTVMSINSDESDKIIDFLEDAHIEYDFQNKHLLIFTKDINKALNILSGFKESIRDFEVRKGTLNDVFLQVTGKEIRVS